MDKVAEEVDTVKKEWNDTYHQILDHINEIQLYGKIKQNNNNNEVTDQDEEEKKKNSLPRLNAMAQDGLTLLSSLQFKLDLLAPQLLSDSEIVATQSLLQSWKTQLQNLRLSLRNANMQAKANMREAALEERGRLLGGGEESTIRRRQLQTKAGMTSAAESITESLRRTRQLMVQEVERTASTLETFEESTGVLKKAESEYKGHRSLLTRTRNLLSTMQRQDVMDRIILGVGFFFFSLAVLYVISKRIGLLKLQRTVTAAIKAGMVRQAEHVPRDIHDGRNPVQANEDLVHRVAAMRDEL